MTLSSSKYLDYGFHHTGASHMHARFLPPLFELCGDLLRPGTRVLDVGCGNGYTIGQFLSRGCDVVGIDLSRSGIELARSEYPKGRFECLPADHDLLTNLAVEPFDIVVSTEVVEHLYAPRPYAAGCFQALRPGGRFICSTPYHGYLKNLVLALSGKMDTHFTALWDGGHIKFWSRATLSLLLTEQGFTAIRFIGVGRVPYIWKSMILVAHKPPTQSNHK